MHLTTGVYCITVAIVSKTVCPSCNSRCVSGNSAQCCSADCVAGCFGGNDNECHVSHLFLILCVMTILLDLLQACSNLNNNGTCVDIAACPMETTVIIEGGLVAPNPGISCRGWCTVHCTTMSRYGNVNTHFLHGLVNYISRWLVQTGRSVSHAVSY